MNDPFAPPLAPLDTVNDTAPKDGLLFWVIAVGATLASIALGLLLPLALPVFESIYVAFGADLPSPTRLLYQGRHALWLALAAPLGAWLYRAKCTHATRCRFRILRSFLAVGLINATLLGFAVWALYLPIIKLGASG